MLRSEYLPIRKCKNCDGGQPNTANGSNATVSSDVARLSCTTTTKKKRTHHKHAKGRYSRKLKQIKETPSDATVIQLLPFFVKNAKSKVIRHIIKLAILMKIRFAGVSTAIWTLVFSPTSAYWKDIRHSKAILEEAKSYGFSCRYFQ